ncbi:MAG: hypothetical protein ACLFST_04035 [Spirochaetia bacterium]
MGSTGTNGRRQFRSCGDLNSYIQTLGSEDAVVFETVLGSFYWADKIEETRALCFIINP